MHEAMVAGYVRDATFAPMNDETLAPYDVAPWLWGRRARRPSLPTDLPERAALRDEVRPLWGT